MLAALLGAEVHTCFFVVWTPCLPKWGALFCPPSLPPDFRLVLDAQVKHP